MAPVNSRLAEKLKELRGPRSFYQVEQESHISRSLIRRYEAGTHTPEEAMLKRLASYYEINYQMLIKLRLEDEYPEGSEKRLLLLEWVDEVRQGS
jgi:transcriptional regulator with XRE-family HTH domain